MAGILLALYAWKQRGHIGPLIIIAFFVNSLPWLGLLYNLL